MSDPARTVHVLLPDGIDDPLRPSGGNHYDRRVCDGLGALGWTVVEHPVPGRWPRPHAAARDRLLAVLDGLGDRSLVLVDGLVASSAPDVVAGAAAALRVVGLVHLPLGVGDPEAHGPEGEMLGSITAVVTTSRWTRRWLEEEYRLPPERIHVAPPGTDRAALTRPGRSGGRLLCVGALTRVKGHDVLLAALDELPRRGWRCTCVGSPHVEPEHAAALRASVRRGGLGERVRFLGALTRDRLAACYRESDLLVLPSRLETYAMVVTEALARGLPVVATDVGGVPEALGRAPDGSLPGLLVPPQDPGRLAAVLRRWLEDAPFRQRLRASARGRRHGLSGWGSTARLVDAALNRAVAGSVVPVGGRIPTRHLGRLERS